MGLVEKLAGIVKIGGASARPKEAVKPGNGTKILTTPTTPETADGAAVPKAAKTGSEPAILLDNEVRREIEDPVLEVLMSTNDSRDEVYVVDKNGRYKVDDEGRPILKDSASARKPAVVEGVKYHELHLEQYFRKAMRAYVERNPEASPLVLENPKSTAGAFLGLPQFKKTEKVWIRESRTNGVQAKYLRIHTGTHNPREMNDYTGAAFVEYLMIKKEDAYVVVKKRYEKSEESEDSTKGIYTMFITASGKTLDSLDEITDFLNGSSNVNIRITAERHAHNVGVEFRRPDGSYPDVAAELVKMRELLDVLEKRGYIASAKGNGSGIK